MSTNEIDTPVFLQINMNEENTMLRQNLNREQIRCISICEEVNLTPCELSVIFDTSKHQCQNISIFCIGALKVVCYKKYMNYISDQIFSRCNTSLYIMSGGEQDGMDRNVIIIAFPKMINQIISHW